MLKAVNMVQIQCRECQKLLTNGQHALYFLAKTILGLIQIQYSHWGNNRHKNADVFNNSTIDNNDGHILLSLIILTCTELHHALLVWQKNTDVPPKASKSKLKADRPDHSHYFNYKNNRCGKNTSCCAATGRRLLTAPGIADRYIFLMNAWNTQQESYHPRVYNNTLSTVKCQIQQVENPMPAESISTDAACIANPNLLDYLTSEVVLENPDIASTDPNIPINNNCTDDELPFWMPGVLEDYDDEGDIIATSDAIHTISWRRGAATDFKGFNLVSSDGIRYKSDDCDNADSDEEDAALQADNGLMQNLED